MKTALPRRLSSALIQRTLTGIEEEQRSDRELKFGPSDLNGKFHH